MDTVTRQRLKYMSEEILHRITDEQFTLKIRELREKYDVCEEDARFRIVPPKKPNLSAEDYFTLSLRSRGNEVMCLYQKRDQYLFACKVVRRSGTLLAPQPFLKVKGMEIEVPGIDYIQIDYEVTYESLIGSSILTYARPDLENAVVVLSQGFDGNPTWGSALATIIGATSEAIKSYEMERHICAGLNIRTRSVHTLSRRLFRINNSWSRISKSINSGDYDVVLEYQNEDGELIKEAVTQFSAGLIFAVINDKKGTKGEKDKRKLEKKEKGERDRDRNEEKEDEGANKSTGKGRKKKRDQGNFRRTRNDSGVVAEDEHEILKETSPINQAQKLEVQANSGLDCKTKAVKDAPKGTEIIEIDLTQ